MIHPMLPREPVTYVEFIAGVRLPVFDDGQRQYVLDVDGEPIYGVWYIPPEETVVPIIVHGREA
jgi:hypothetical protein